MLQLIHDVKNKSGELKAFNTVNCSSALTTRSKLVNDGVSSLSEPFLTPPADYPHLSSETCAFGPEDNVTSITSACTSGRGMDLSMNFTDNVSKLIGGDVQNFCSPPTSETGLNNNCEPHFDWIEEEMARVCGEGSANSKNPLKINLPSLEESMSGFTITQSKEDSSLPCDSKLSQKNQFENGPRDPCTNITNWKLVRMKHEAEVEKKLQRAQETGGTEKRIKLEKRFTELFGSSETLDGKKKDEIAAFTVKHLMPMYKKQRIASKDLFKKLAKHISEHVMCKYPTPDEGHVHSKVCEYFKEGKSVKSVEDIHC